MELPELKTTTSEIKKQKNKEKNKQKTKPTG